MVKILVGTELKNIGIDASKPHNNQLADYIRHNAANQCSRLYTIMKDEKLRLKALLAKVLTDGKKVPKGFNAKAILDNLHVN